MDYKGAFFSLMAVMALERLKEKVLYSQNMFLVFLMGFFTALPHEIAHYFVALILGGKPEGIHLIPKKVIMGDKIYYTFGSVRSYVNGLTAFFIGLAPLLWLIAGYIFAEYWNKGGIRGTIVFFLTEWIFITNGIPSKTDLKVAFSSVWGWILTFITIGGIVLWVK